ncbi:MAG: tRNA (adenosine(37)-N6)-threonylcarbamoyltransferase complex dimerization subunit type 1 TsaB, partial [Gammaproteobacteria bacterium]|nr:tRNA (adenosine(37)-N6)-threonylcarbamoyltransferase complex dimerization subunit type 1 TsaB [Gammaproteobacteria bacterium]
GDGWQSYPQMLARHRSRVIAMEPDLLPSARELMELAQAEFAAGRTVSAAQALPEYLGHEPAYRM